MNKFKYYFILIITCLSLFSCSKDDNSVETVPLRDFQEQFTADNITIEEYLNNYYLDLDFNDPNFADKDVVIKKITDLDTQSPIMDYLDSATFPKLLSKNVELHGITYKLYYLVLREGIGEKPCNVDGVLAAYSGEYLYKSTANEVTTLTPTPFEKVIFPQSFFNLYEVVTGWSEVFPEFKTGNNVPYKDSDGKEDGTLVHTDFGAGVMFLPSGLAYYNTGKGAVPSYVPLVFSFKLYAINRSDLDNDGIPSYLEDVNGDGYMRVLATGVANPDDSDGDGVPDFLDIDDDGDGFTTRSEITKPANQIGVVNGINYGPSKYYPYNAFTVEDDPTTPDVDESLQSELRGIPAFAATGEPDYTSSGRLRLHLDKAHHTEKP